ncbi:MAG: 4-(cytidine 5'-diphospho)-2-C-methyl-D-erythritol kinase [Firmicutes bacterium]|nr:4-(cytidine 5'-diphospho)-2-C-methyl-D-erythritol kinase [Bacillota bacterium]
MNLYKDIVITKNRATAKSYAKINLTLDVLGKLPNGYHEVKMIMQSINLFDLVIVDKVPHGIHISTNCKFIPRNDKNIAYKAAKLFFEKTAIAGGAKILIHKNIPVSAGLAGGSGNAAAVLCALNILYNMPLGDEIYDIALSLGADVPYCIDGGTCLAEGIGEKLTQLSPLPQFPVVLVKPPISISTAEIYKKIDLLDTPLHPDTDKALCAIENGDFDTLFKTMKNVMEEVTKKICPEIEEISETMYRLDARVSLMSGSGPTVYGIFEDEYSAKKAYDVLSKKYQQTFFAHILN